MKKRMDQPTRTDKTMTHAEALKELIETRTLSTGMLQPFGITFETFLNVDIHHPNYGKAIDKLIAREQKKATKIALLKEHTRREALKNRENV